MSTKTEVLKEVLAAAGGNVETLKDNLETTILKAIVQVLSEASGDEPGGSNEPVTISIEFSLDGSMYANGCNFDMVLDCALNNKPINIEFDGAVYYDCQLLKLNPLNDGTWGYGSYIAYGVFEYKDLLDVTMGWFKFYANSEIVDSWKYH